MKTEQDFAPSPKEQRQDETLVKNEDRMRQ